MSSENLIHRATFMPEEIHLGPRTDCCHCKPEPPATCPRTGQPHTWVNVTSVNDEENREICIDCNLERTTPRRLADEP